MVPYGSVDFRIDRKMWSGNHNAADGQLRDGALSSDADSENRGVAKRQSRGSAKF